MEVSVATIGAVLVGITVIVIAGAWRLLNWLWLRPKKLERYLRQQGLTGNSYRFYTGDMKEISTMIKQAYSKPVSLSHDIAPRVVPFDYQLVNTCGKNSFVWMGPTPRVNITDPEDLKTFLTKMDDFPKPKANPLIKLLATGIALYEGEKWAKHRRIINPVFHLEKLKRMLPEFYQSCSEMIVEWESLMLKEGSCELDVWPYFQNMTADVISRTAFGSSYKEGRKIFELLKEQAQLAIKVIRSVYIPGARFLPTKINMKMKEIDREIRALLMGIINKREDAIRAGEATKDDLLGVLMESNLSEIKEHGNNKKVGMSMHDVIEECKLFYFAGQETTSVLLVWTMVLLGQYQNWQDRAREEILQVFGSNKPEFDEIIHLKVVTMILHEVLRLYPAVTVMTRTTIKETQLSKYSLPAGVEVALPTLLVHHDKQLWGDDAHEFKPERFSEGVLKATKNKFIYFPFGGGPRNCIGQTFAMVEVKLALSLILQHFTFELSPSYAHAPSLNLTLQPLFGAHIILHKC
ncbi:cytochrome P450 CYP72A219-like isoform X1 [Pyrus x bretschneideri]|uniref:cytochrome P450 CYP72A219-like isoform X1 n=1 Tax=Pyrus x bretschneideri TaxID=225117 RepID=UPI00202DE45F|nr:cytochrome P450 CYP72A219-like isoform X1 [Pyrus x bretschneideri]